MIPPVKLELLALGLAGWPLELEDDTRGSYEADLIVLPTPVPYECRSTIPGGWSLVSVMPIGLALEVVQLTGPQQ